MTRWRTILFLILGVPWSLTAQRLPDWEIEPFPGPGSVTYNFETGIATATNGVKVRYGEAVLTADRVAVNQTTGEVLADGRVRIQQGDQVWASEHILYNFLTRHIQAEQFRTGKSPLFAAGEGLHVDLTNKVYTATNALITTEDLSSPFIKLRASRIRIQPGDKITAYDAFLYIGNVPVFYFPYYSRKLGERANHFNVTPGYRGSYGAYALGSYTFFLNEQFDGVLHLDYRTERGVGLGPDLTFRDKRWGEANLRYYYLHDLSPNESSPNLSIPSDRQRVWFSWSAQPYTNFQALSVVRYQSDPAIVHDFFESEYRQNPQPNTFLELNKFWDNFSVDMYVQPRVNDFLETVERLPDVRLTGYRQKLGPTPLYYESQSSLGFYQRRFADELSYFASPPGDDYSAARGDTFHQVLLPHTFFGWLNVTPRAGGRFTYYGEAHGPGGYTDEETRGVFNTGMEVNFKASRLWRGAQNRVFDIDGVRHILQPMVNYSYVPEPSAVPQELPQFDFEMPTLRLLPNEFPDYNAIDAIDSQNVIRLGVRNRLQTKRRGQVVDVVNWDLYTDWRIDPNATQDDFSDVFSDLILRPRSWLTLESLIRYDAEDEQLRLSLHSVRLQPNNTWSVGVTHFYLRDDFSTAPGSTGVGNNSVGSTVFYRFNENWGARASHYYNVRESELQEQFYSIYRDLRSWTAALTFAVRRDLDRETDYSVAFTFSLKAFPRYGLGADTVAPYTLLGW